MLIFSALTMSHFIICSGKFFPVQRTFHAEAASVATVTTMNWMRLSLTATSEVLTDISVVTIVQLPKSDVIELIREL